MLRQTQLVSTTEQMHSFLKDKTAWENAIAMYQGPDPLDHWYNYICWYENHRHGDPDSNQFRQALERCLSIFEHTDYYKQDVRMVRLWLKYIDMQPNPLHFYQVLHTRGFGKQVALFYISWAGYYESVNALKEAEAVFNVAFKEKAQSYAELHHAHSKFMYAHSLNSATTQIPTATPIQVHIQHQQQQQYQPVQHVSNQISAAHSPHPVQQISYSNSNMRLQTQSQPHHHIQQQQHSSGHLNAQTVITYQQQQVHQQQQNVALQQQQQQEALYRQKIQANSYTHSTSQTHNYVQGQQQQIQPQLHHQIQHTQHRVIEVDGQQQQTYLHQIAQPLTPPIGVPVEQQLPATSAHAVSQIQTHQQHYYLAHSENQMSDQQQQQKHQQLRVADTQPVSASLENSTNQTPEIENMTRIPGIKLPKKFANFSSNNYETWKPALFLEEPEDPCRQCHYKKQQVYPDGENIEYSPEELFARRYLKQTSKQIENDDEAVIAYAEDQNQDSLQDGDFNQEERVFQQISSYNVVEHQQQYLYSSSSNNIYQLTDPNGVQATENEVDTDAGTGGEEYEEEDEEEEENYEYEQDEEEEEEQTEQVQHKKSGVNDADDVEDQIEASTIRFSMHSEQEGLQNKTIKIKFKKEPTQQHSNNSNKSFNGNYSSYTVVQNNYQQEQPNYKPHQLQHHHVQKQQHQQMQVNNLKAIAHKVGSPEVRRNGHSFHPYMMNQTSTPKSGTTSGNQRHYRNKLKKISKFTVATGSSSNSSSADNAANGFSNGHNNYGNDTSFHNATFNDNANYSFSSAAALDNSNCSLTSAVDRLNFRDTTFSGVAGPASKLNATNVADFSTYQENSYFATQHDTEAKERRLQKAIATIKTHLARESVDPFNSELCRAFLTKIDFPNAIHADETESVLRSSYLKVVQTPLPKLSNTRVLTLPDAGNIQFNIDKEVGRGSYGSVYKATNANTGTIVALKYQKPPNTWEIYICDQVLKRVRSPNILPGLMDISLAIIAPNASLIATEFSPFGSLLDINNKIRQATTKVMHESLVMHFSAQICNIIFHLHQQKIIHADIKPDNFLLMRVPSTDLHYPSLRLIDFGCAIDMTLFPNEQKFRKVIQTDGFTCVEMQEGRTWTYETDIFCIAGTVHVMLFGEYMQLQKRAGTWDIKQKLPRYLKKHVWTKFFSEVLNIKSGKLPDLKEYRDILLDETRKMDSELQKQIRTLSNILYRR